MVIARLFQQTDVGRNEASVERVFNLPSLSPSPDHSVTASRRSAWRESASLDVTVHQVWPRASTAWIGVVWTPLGSIVPSGR